MQLDNVVGLHTGRRLGRCSLGRAAWACGVVGARNGGKGGYDAAVYYLQVGVARRGLLDEAVALSCSIGSALVPPLALTNVLCGRMFALLRAGMPHGDAPAEHHKLFSRCGTCSPMAHFVSAASLEALLGIEISSHV